MTTTGTAPTPSTGPGTTTAFPLISYDDARAGVTFLTAVGFTPTALYWSPEDPDLLDHGELRWPGGGAVMCGSADRESSGGYERRVGAASTYCVVAGDADVDLVYRTALDAGATSLQEPSDPDYGGRTCAVRDAEGNQWSFGSYAGHGG